MDIATGTVHTEGADIVYDYQGDGPLLLLIAGGGGHAARHYRLMNVLAERYTVVTYDRRGNSRSVVDTETDLDMAQQARDAAAVIKAMGHDKAFVFGNSGGANIALELAADHPEMITAMVAHEGPTLLILPDAEACLAWAERVHKTYLTEGATAAMEVFNECLVGFDPLPPAGAMQNADFFMAREFLPISTYRPDFDAIRGNRVPLATAAGHDSADAYYARTARLHADLLGCEYAEFPGNHLAFIFDPPAFATALTDLLHKLAGDRTE
ncbi:alpha/beta fold hydrolase [Sphaerisporangium fuscum]|uniref:alpha/beta fold hydrolase n=1 Tax=Sphaerisporangium fuscum TaxID=2835868 RepID=UPI001BDCFF37|nr:alpha/beta hydrolase [Sphaerisporangium fuscum]